MKKRFKISPDGNVVGLWDDVLAGLGEAKVSRASRVEFNEEHGGWQVELCIGPDAGCFLPQLFERRKDALGAEVSYLNDVCFPLNTQGVLHG